VLYQLSYAGATPAIDLLKRIRGHLSANYSRMRRGHFRCFGVGDGVFVRALSSLA